MTQVALVGIDAGQLPSVESGVNISTAARRWRPSHGLSRSRDPGEDAAAVVRRPRAAFSPCQPHLPWMIVPMGCGGSRADAIIEPRYHESWTRETESTWLTNTDVETSLPVANSKALEASLREKRMVNTGTQCGKQALTSTSSNHQRRPRRSLSDQTTRESKRRASKEASALSKDGQPVNINSSGDAEPENVCDER
ncbi:uncharacterized protein si:ch211-215i13.3 isoform X2 [Pungitius pungitius]|uniref:uncharacterized protein si:ch211-215i13.3 isoform X2 n=1 Tax=Pungitius pungitius TaxID=134920 RepID=UPI002E122CA6